MAFTRPTLQELVTRIEADFVSRLTGGGALLRKALVKVLARVQAGTAHHLYGYIAWMLKQVIIDTAESTYLRRWARIFDVEPIVAEFSQGYVIFTGTNATSIPAETELQSADGRLYLTQALGTISSGTATIAIKAEVAGADGDIDTATELTLVSPIAGINSIATVTGADGITGGLDAESDASLLERLLARIQSPPHGGNENDYIAWAREVSGVTRAWILPQQFGPGTLAVLFVVDDLDPIIPNPTKVAEVQDYIDDPSRRPVTADVTVIAPTGVPINPNIELTPDTAEVRAAVQAELIDLLARDGEPGGTILLSKINEAISIASGETDHILNSPSADVTHTAIQIPTLGTITWS